VKKGPPRKFDYEEARHLYETSGLTQREVGLLFGVSDSAVWFAIHPEAMRRARRRSSEWHRGGRCPDCGGPSTRYSKTQSRRCRDCTNARQVTSVRADGTLRCGTCREWKPSEAFPFSRSKNRARGGRSLQCRACQTILRQAYRERHKVPCRNCGQPRLAPNETGARYRGHNQTGLCLRCYRESLRKIA
jgi:hypothetical protein